MDSGLITSKTFHRKPLLLKDYLMEEISSCSSNGFKSFPRRKCCSGAVPFLRELDLKNKQLKEKLKCNKSARKFSLAAFRSVLDAVKRFHFAAVAESKKRQSFSVVKLLGRSGFWKRKTTEVKEIEHWKSLDQLMKEEDSYPSDCPYKSPESSFTTVPVAAECLSDENCSGGKNNVAEDTKEAVIDDSDVGTKNDDVSDESTISSVSYSNCSTKIKENEEKEQLSPLSVLDCSFNELDDDHDDISSPFQQRLDRMEGTKKKLMKKIHMFECLAKLEPLNLVKHLAESDNESFETTSPLPHSTDEKSISNIEEQLEEEEKQVEERALEFFHQIKVSSPSYDYFKLKLDKLLIDFFKASIVNHPRENMGDHSFDNDGLFVEAQDWINGRKLTLGMVVKPGMENNMKVCLRDMDEGGEWKTLDQENKVVALLLESEVFNVLMDELLLDISI